MPLNVNNVGKYCKLQDTDGIKSSNKTENVSNSENIDAAKNDALTAQAENNRENDEVSVDIEENKEKTGVGNFFESIGKFFAGIINGIVSLFTGSKNDNDVTDDVVTSTDKVTNTDIDTPSVNNSEETGQINNADETQTDNNKNTFNDEENKYKTEINNEIESSEMMIKESLTDDEYSYLNLTGFNGNVMKDYGELLYLKKTGQADSDEYKNMVAKYTDRHINWEYVEPYQKSLATDLLNDVTENDNPDWNYNQIFAKYKETISNNTAIKKDAKNERSEGFEKINEYMEANPNYGKSTASPLYDENVDTHYYMLLEMKKLGQTDTDNYKNLLARFTEEVEEQNGSSYSKSFSKELLDNIVNSDDTTNVYADLYIKYAENMSNDTAIKKDAKNERSEGFIKINQYTEAKANYDESGASSLYNELIDTYYYMLLEMKKLGQTDTDEYKNKVAKFNDIVEEQNGSSYSKSFSKELLDNIENSDDTTNIYADLYIKYTDDIICEYEGYNEYDSEIKTIKEHCNNNNDFSLFNEFMNDEYINGTYFKLVLMKKKGEADSDEYKNMVSELDNYIKECNSSSEVKAVGIDLLNDIKTNSSTENNLSEIFIKHAKMNS